MFSIMYYEINRNLYIYIYGYNLQIDMCSLCTMGIHDDYDIDVLYISYNIYIYIYACNYDIPNVVYTILYTCMHHLTWRSIALCCIQFQYLHHMNYI